MADVLRRLRHVPNYESDDRPGEIDITTGSLDHPDQFPPTKDIFPQEKLPWVQLVNGSKG